MLQRKMVSACGERSRTAMLVLVVCIVTSGFAQSSAFSETSPMGGLEDSNSTVEPLSRTSSVEPPAVSAVEPTGEDSVSTQLKDNWNEFLHYMKIGRLDLAKGYAQAILESNPDPAQLMNLSKENPVGYEILLRVVDSAPDAELVMLSKQIINIIEHGKFTGRAEPKNIVEEIKRLSSTERGWTTAVKRLQNAGEYAIPYMLDAMTDPSRKEEFPKIVLALPHIGKDAIRPLTTALQIEDVAVKAEIIKALGQIGYPHSLAYLKYIIENDQSQELRALAGDSIKQIDPKGLEIPAAHLFYRLAEQYYYHTASLAPAEEADFANIWFWDTKGQKLSREQVNRSYFYELMAMRACEWSLKADPEYSRAIGLWLAAFFKAQSSGAAMPDYFGTGHGDALIYATTAGPEYLHLALARAVKDNDAYVALGVIEALATTAGPKTLLYQVGTAQPLVKALSFNNKAVRYSAALAIAEAAPTEKFAESKYVVRNLAEALVYNQQSTTDADSLDKSTEHLTPQDALWRADVAYTYALRSAKAMLKVAQGRDSIINISAAQRILINAINDEHAELQILVSQILAHIKSPEAQGAIAVMAMSSQNSKDVRIAAFKSLATSAKLNANMLVEQMVDDIYALISSSETDPELRSSAAAAYGALNLPSRKVKDLILDQAKS